MSAVRHFLVVTGGDTGTASVHAGFRVTTLSPHRRCSGDNSCSCGHLSPVKLTGVVTRKPALALAVPVVTTVTTEKRANCNE